MTSFEKATNNIENHKKWQYITTGETEAETKIKNSKERREEAQRAYDFVKEKGLPLYNVESEKSAKLFMDAALHCYDGNHLREILTSVPEENDRRIALMRKWEEENGKSYGVATAENRETFNDFLANDIAILTLMLKMCGIACWFAFFFVIIFFI